MPESPKWLLIQNFTSTFYFKAVFWMKKKTAIKTVMHTKPGTVSKFLVNGIGLVWVLCVAFAQEQWYEKICWIKSSWDHMEPRSSLDWLHSKICRLKAPITVKWRQTKIFTTTKYSVCSSIFLNFQGRFDNVFLLLVGRLEESKMYICGVVCAINNN